MVRVKFNVFERIRNILLTPRTEWPVIEREFTEPAFLFVRYVAILAIIPALAGFIGMSLVGVKVSVGTFREPVASGVSNAVISYLLTFMVVYVVAMIIDLLAGFFGGRRHFMNALKLSVYAHTPVWLAGVFLLMPGLRFLTVLGLYSVHLLWTGLPVLMDVPRNRAPFYALAIIVLAFIVIVLLALIKDFVFALPRAL
jgi:hypothetical protein